MPAYRKVTSLGKLPLLIEILSAMPFTDAPCVRHYGVLTSHITK